MATIRKRGKSWQVQIRRDGHAPISKSFQLRSDAASWARETERRIERGEQRQATRNDHLTLSDALKRYAEEVSVKKRGTRSEQSRLRSLQSGPLANIHIAKLRPEDLAAYRNARLRHVKSDTVRKELGLLRHCLEVGRREWGLPLTSNPMADVLLPKPGPSRNIRLSDTEFSRLYASLDQCRAWYMKPIAMLAIQTGMRRGELLQIKWDDINYHTSVVYIKLTKNGDPRSVPLSLEAIDILKGLKIKTRFVFPITGNAIHLSWERVRKRAELDHLRFHDLRHEAISRFFEMGLSVPEVALISGHKDVRMLFRYTHIRPENVAKKLADIHASRTVAKASDKEPTENA